MKNKYSKYKPSGVEWIGDIPEHWGMVKMKYLGETIIGLSYSPEDMVDENEGILVLRSSNIQDRKLSLEDNVYVKTKVKDKIILREGDILICSRNGSRNLIGKNIVIDSRMVGNTFGVFMCIFRTKYWGFVSHILNSPIFYNQSDLFLTSTINQLTSDTLNNFVIPFTEDKNEQRQIVKYLDEKTGEIDNLISITEKKIELLKENRTSTINRVITKGLDPNVELIDSGIEWIGEIPKHWDFIELKYVLDLLTDFESNGSFSSVKENVKVDDEGEVWYVRMTDLENGNIRNEKCKYCDMDTYKFLTKTRLEGGELLITKRGEIGKVYLFPEKCGLSTLGPNSYLLRLKKERVLSNHLYYFYLSEGGQITLKLMDNSTTIGSLYKDDVKGSMIVLPPLPEQEQIVKYLDQITQKISALISIEQQRIETLKEYRQSLISEVITGKLRVCEENYDN